MDENVLQGSRDQIPTVEGCMMNGFALLAIACEAKVRD